MNHKVIEVKSLIKSYKAGKEDIAILKNLSFDIVQGEFVSIMGPSGCGKSTLLYLTGGLDRPTSGDVYINGHNVNTLKDKHKSILRRRTIGFVFQFYNLVANLTVEENILLPILMDGKKERDFKEELESLLETTELSERRKFLPRELSGGQQQRVAIARSLISQPSILLADEPIGNLDSSSGTEIMKLFRKINQEKGITILQVTHSREAANYGNRIIHLRDGMIEHNEVIEKSLIHG